MKKILAIFAALLAGSALMAQENVAPAVETSSEVEPFSRWSVSLGVSYRKFHKVDFKHRSAGSFEDAVIVGGTLLENTQAAVNAAALEYFGGAMPGSSAAISALNFASFSGASYKSEEKVDTFGCFAPAIGAETNLWQDEDFTVKAVAGLQYFFNIDADDKKGGNGTLDIYGRRAVYNALDGNTYPNYSSTTSATIGDADIKSTGRTKFSADLFVLDLGAKGVYRVSDEISVFAAVGPTLTIAQIDSSSYSAVSSNGVKLASAKYSDNKNKVRLGYYISGGAQYDIDENWAVSAELRWDDTFGKLKTKVAEQRLDSLGGVLKVIYNF